jgi:uncharacterized protein
MDEFALTLVVATLLAAVVNGALGYGFSSITVPIALLVMSNRILNPALVLVEIVLNIYMVWVNRESVPVVWGRVRPIVIGLTPGIVCGTLLIAWVSPSWLRLGTFAALLPLILMQAAGWRRPLRDERSWGPAFGCGLGVLYSVTTISGPPLALLFNNQGLAKREFRAGLGIVRLAESLLTAIAYLATGLFTADSLSLVPHMIPSIAIGVPIGAMVIRHIEAETFRRLCMSFDAWIVALGCSRLLIDLNVATSAVALTLPAVVVALDLALLAHFFRRRQPPATVEAAG